MNRFFCPSKDISNQVIKITDKDEVRHISRSLRLKAGCDICVFDGTGKEYFGIIRSIDSDSVIVEITNIKEKAVCNIEITLACAIPKKAKFDFIIEKAVELGVFKIIPLKTERTIVKIDKEKKCSKLLRWQAIALNAAKQCQNSFVPVVFPAMDFKDCISDLSDYDLKLIPNLSPDRKHIKDVLNNPGVKKVIILIGPEGDFSENEIELAKKSGFVSVSLGELTLKVDTAAIMAVGIFNILS